MSNFIPKVGDEFILHCALCPNADGTSVVTKVISMEPVAKEKPKSEAEKLQDLLRDVGNDAFCKIMAETIEEHNKLHKEVVRELDVVCSTFWSMDAPLTLNRIDTLRHSVFKKLDK